MFVKLETMLSYLFELAHDFTKSDLLLGRSQCYAVEYVNVFRPLNVYFESSEDTQKNLTVVGFQYSNDRISNKIVGNLRRI